MDAQEIRRQAGKLHIQVIDYEMKITRCQALRLLVDSYPDPEPIDNAIMQLKKKPNDIDHIRRGIDDLIFRRSLLPIFELEFCLLRPRPPHYLLSLPATNPRAVFESYRLRILAFTTSREPSDLAAFIHDLEKDYAYPPKRFDVLLGLSTWFDLRPKHFLRHLGPIIDIALTTADDGRLLAKHLVAILRAAARNLRFVTLPLDAVPPDFRFQYQAIFDYHARHTGTGAKAISSNFKTHAAKFEVLWTRSDPKPADIDSGNKVVANAFQIGFLFFLRSLSLEFFFDDTETADDALPEKLGAFGEFVGDVFDNELRDLAPRIRFLTAYGNSDHEKFRRFRDAVQRLPDVIAADLSAFREAYGKAEKGAKPKPMPTLCIGDVRRELRSWQPEACPALGPFIADYFIGIPPEWARGPEDDGIVIRDRRDIADFYVDAAAEGLLAVVDQLRSGTGDRDPLLRTFAKLYDTMRRFGSKLLGPPPHAQVDPYTLRAALWQMTKGVVDPTY